MSRPPTGESPTTLPVMCSLTPEAIAAGRAGLLPDLSQRAIAVLAIELTLSGPEGAREFLAALFSL